MVVPSGSFTAILAFLDAAMRVRTREAAIKLHSQWDAGFSGEPWWGVGPKGEALDPIQTVLHARDALLPWSLQRREEEAAAKKVAAAKAANYRKALRSGAIDDCIMPGWRKPWSKAGTTMVRFSKG